MLTKLKVLRLRRELSQMELAKKVGMDNTRLSRVENGFSAAYKTEQAKLAQYFQVEVGDLFDNRGFALQEPTKGD